MSLRSVRWPVSPLLVVLLFLGGHMANDLTVPCAHRRHFFPQQLGVDDAQPFNLCPWENGMDSWTKTSGGPKCLRFETNIVRAVKHTTCEPLRNTTHLRGHVWLMNSPPELGLMIHDFTQMVEFYETCPPRTQVTLLWGDSRIKVEFRRQWADPFLDLLIGYYQQRKNITTVQLSSLSAGYQRSVAWSRAVLSHTCLWRLHPPHHGNCAGFFNSHTGPKALRRMVSATTGADLHMQACRGGSDTPLSVLLFDRQMRRYFKNPKKMQLEVNTTLRQAWPTRQVDFQYINKPPAGLVAQCRLFSQFDFIIMAHGAGMSNLICARPCAMVAEIGWGARSKWLFLRKPMMLHSCFVAVTNRSAFYGSIEPTNLTSCVNKFIALHS